MLSCQHGSRENQTIRKDFPKLSQNVTQGINESWKENTERGRKKKKTNIQIKTDKTCKMLKSGSPELWEGSRSKHKETMSECQRGLWDGQGFCIFHRIENSEDLMQNQRSDLCFKKIWILLWSVLIVNVAIFRIRLQT